MTNAYMATIATGPPRRSTPPARPRTTYVTSDDREHDLGQRAARTTAAFVAYITKAYGLPAGATKDTIAKALQSDTTAKTSFANRSPYPSYLAVAKGFNFTSDGVAGPLPFQSPDQRNATMQLYMQRAAGDTTTAAAATAYYAATIGTVHSIADLQKDPKLTSYVLTAYGIDPKTPSATVASILNQTKSVDTGYLALAQAFNARSDGTVASGTPFQSTAQQQSTIQLFGARAGVSAATAATATAYYTANIGKVHSVGDLLADPKLLNYALTAFAIDTKTSAATLTAVLENTGGVDDSYKALATDFAFGGDGLAQTVTSAQTAAGTSATTTAYMATVGADADAQTAAATETAYFTSRIGQVKTIADLLGDSRLKAYVTQAFGLSASLTTKTITSALTSDLGNPYSVANVQGGAVLAMAKAFAFTTAGTPSTRAQAQTSAQQDATVARYDANAGVDSATQSAAAAYYRAHIGAVQSVGDLESDPKLLSYVETAYGLDSTTSATTLASLLEARQSLVETAPTASLLAMKLAFNVDAQGNATTAWAAQSAASVTATTAAYMKNAPSDKASQAKAQAATAYYKTAIGSVTSVSGLLNDPKLVAYLEQAYAIPATTTTDSLRKILTSDVTDNKSVANSLGAATEALAAAFNFGATGLVATVPQAAQSKAQLDALQTAYIQNAIETEAGVQNPGIKLALYLQFNASKITDAYSILADKQLTQIFHTILGLPATASNADIDAQAKTITDKINLADLKNPKKLLALIQRFSVLYDLNPPASTAPLTSVSTLTGSITASNPLDVTTLFS